MDKKVLEENETKSLFDLLKSHHSFNEKGYDDNFVPKKGQICFDHREKKIKIGDGEKTWKELDYMSFFNNLEKFNKEKH